MTGRPHPEREAPVTEVEVRGPMIRLGQLLKLTGLVDSGGEVRPALAAERVMVNGVVESRRGRQLHPGDVVQADGHRVKVVRAPDDPDQPDRLVS